MAFGAGGEGGAGLCPWFLAGHGCPVLDGLLRDMGVCSGSSGLAAGPLRLADPGFSFCWGRPPLLKACRNTWTGSGPGYAAAGSAAGPGFGAGILCGRRVFSGRLRGSSVEGPDSLLDGASPCGKMPCQLPSFSHGLVLLWLMGRRGFRAVEIRYRSGRWSFRRRCGRGRRGWWN
jgi:hypothetical protein